MYEDWLLGILTDRIMKKKIVKETQKSQPSGKVKPVLKSQVKSFVKEGMTQFDKWCQDFKEHEKWRLDLAMWRGLRGRLKWSVDDKNDVVVDSRKLERKKWRLHS